MNSLPSTGSCRGESDRFCRFRPIEDGRFRVAMEVTRRCNIACKHCFVPDGRKDPPLEQLLGLIDALKPLGCRKLILTGGEPLLRKDLEQIIRAAVDAGIGVDLNSNFVTLTERRASALVDAGLTEASISFYGDPAFHDDFVGLPGGYQRVVQACKLLRGRGLDVDVHGPLWAKNLDFAPMIFEECERLGIGSLTFFKVVGLQGDAEEQMFGPTRFDAKPDEYEQAEPKALWIVISELRDRQTLPVRTVGFVGHAEGECEQSCSILGLSSGLELSPCLLSRHRGGLAHAVTGKTLEDTLGILRREVSNGLWEPVCGGPAE